MSAVVAVRVMGMTDITAIHRMLLAQTADITISLTFLWYAQQKKGAIT